MGGLRESLGESAGAFREVFRNRNLRRLQLAWAGSVAGQYAFSVAVAVYAYAHGGAAAVGAMALIRSIPAAAAAPFAGALGDRYPRERVMLASDLGRAAFVLAMGGCVLAGTPAWIVFVLAAFGPICGTAFHPSQSGLLPSLARTPEELTAANVSSSTIESVSGFVGPAVGGLVLAAWGPGAAFCVTGAAFLWSAALVAGVRPPRAAEGEADGEEEHARHDVLAGFKTVLREPQVRLIVGLFSAQAVVAGAMGVLVVVTALQLLHIGNAGVGWLYSACGIGGLVGAVIAMALIRRRRLAGDFGAGLLLWGIPFVLIGVWPSSAVAFVCLGLLGVGNTLVDVSALTLLQRNAPPEVLSRVFGVLEGLFVATVGLGAVLAPALIGLFGIRAALIVVGLFLPVLAGLLWRQLTALDAGARVPPERVELLQSIPIFAALPAGPLERLAAALQSVPVPAGAYLFREGDPGNRFYVVGTGELEVLLPGGTKIEGPGGWVGEIALLRDIPRTASVRAGTDAQLWALSREDFLGAVTGHARNRQAANDLIGARLAPVPV